MRKFYYVQHVFYMKHLQKTQVPEKYSLNLTLWICYFQSEQNWEEGDPKVLKYWAILKPLIFHLGQIET